MTSVTITRKLSFTLPESMLEPQWLLPLYLLLTWLIWRLWKFSIRPLLYTKEVEYLPYSIPFIGHAVPMFKSTARLYTQAIKHFNGLRKTYALHVMGRDIVIVSDPAEQSLIYKDSSSYSINGSIDMIYKCVGEVSPDAHKNLWHGPEDGFQSLHPNPKGQVLVHMGYSLLHKQLLQPEKSQELIQKNVSYIEQYTGSGAFFDTSVLASNAKGDQVVSLHKWCLEVLIESQTRIFFGKTFREIQPDYKTLFDAWDFNSWMMTYQYPHFLAKAATRPRNALFKALTQYLDMPRDERDRESVPFVNELQDELENGGLGSEDIARVLFVILWGVNTNVHTAAFWLLAHVLVRPTLAEALMEEIAPAMQAIEKADSKDPAALTEIVRTRLIQDAPLLNATFDETVRTCSTNASTRDVKRPVSLGGKVLKPGTVILMPQRPNLLAPEAFGGDAEDFNPHRFLQNKKLTRQEFFRPFGGGVTLCSGRTVARYEVLTFVAFALWRYDIKVVGEGERVQGVYGKGFPRLDEAKPSLGVAKQCEGDDVIVVLRKKTT
ncbi:hypothetical protein PG989_010805 [Apiospora arundinis]